jgi:transposase InsO family protein
MLTTPSDFVFDVISIDISGPFPESSKYNRYILTVVDLFSRYTILVPIIDQKAKTIADALLSQVISHYGTPSAILTDQGTQFESALFQELCDLLKIAKLRTSSYHPQTNGVNERNHRTVNQVLRIFQSENPESEWDVLIPTIMLALNSNVHDSIGFSPYEVMFGRPPQMPEDLLYKPAPVEDCTIHEYVQKVRYQHQVIGAQIIENLQKSYLLQKRNYQKKGVSHWYEIGDEVYLSHIPALNESRKLAPRWEGPYEVLETRNYPVLEIARDGRQYSVHHNRVKPCNMSTYNKFARLNRARGTYPSPQNHCEFVYRPPPEPNEDANAPPAPDDDLDPPGGPENPPARVPRDNPHHNLRPFPTPPDRYTSSFRRRAKHNYKAHKRLTM